MRLFTVILGVCAGTTNAQYFYAANASTSGTWAISKASDSEGEYLFANDTEDASVTFNTSQISPDGNYSVVIYTPGCLDDDTCDQRGTVSIVGNYATKTAAGISTSTRIAQTNEYDKYDLIYVGGVNASKDGFSSSVKLSPIPNSIGIVVAQKIQFQLLAVFEDPESTATETTSVSSQNGTATTQTGTSAAPTIPNVTVTASASARPGGLDESAKIGIGVGVSLGALICIVVAVLVYLRRKQRIRVAQVLPHQGSGAEDEAKSAGAQLHGESSHREMQGESAQAELPAGSTHTELPGGLAHAELPGKLMHIELPDHTVLERRPSDL